MKKSKSINNLKEEFESLFPGKTFVTYNDVKHVTDEEYFHGNHFSIDAVNKKYKLSEQESFIDAIHRVATEVAKVEKTEEERDYWSKRFFNDIYNDIFKPAGSIMQGAGNPGNISLANCTTLSLGTNRDEEEWDSLEAIVRNTMYKVCKSAAFRQGLGVDFSRIRPSGTKVNNSSKQSQGVVHWMKFIDSAGYTVGQLGRLPAMLLSLRIDHPDIELFIDAKKDFINVQNANISVQVTDAFYKALEKGEKVWKTKFTIPARKKGDKVYVEASTALPPFKKDEKGYYYEATRNRAKEVIEREFDPKELLNKIAHNMFRYAEPGIQNIDLAKKYSNSDYVYDESLPLDTRIVSTNACVTGETPILTDKGYFPIIDLVGKKVKVWNGVEFSEVEPKRTGTNKPILKVTTNVGLVLNCTDYHEWAIVDEEGEKKVSTKDLQPGMELAPFNYPVIDEGTEGFTAPYISGLYAGTPIEPDNFKTATIATGAIVDAVAEQVSQELGELEIDHDVDTADGIGEKSALVYIGYVPPHPKETVPFGSSLAVRKVWLSGLIDSAGTVNQETGYIEITHPEQDFLRDVQLLFTTIGMLTTMDNTSSKHVLLVPFNEAARVLPLHCSLITLNKENRYPSPKIKILIEDVRDAGIADKVYCFTEPKLNKGCFNGIVTYQCSEQYLDKEGLCILSSIVASSFSTDEEEMKKQLMYAGSSINRFLDNVITLELEENRYATDGQRLSLTYLRRTGAGYTDLAGWLFKAGLAYGTPEASEKVETFTKYYNYALYKSSERLGKERGSFKAFKKEKWLNSPFVKNMQKHFPDLKFDHMRNVTCSSIAPTGTLSLTVSRQVMSNGIEPAFGAYYWKRTRISGKYEYYFVVPSIVREEFARKGYPIPGMKSDSIKDTWDGKYGKPIAEHIDKYIDEVVPGFTKPTDINPLDKLDLMARVGKWIDSSISVTYMLPEDTSVDDVAEFILEARRRNLKSIAAFPDKLMYGIVSDIPFKELALKLKALGQDIHPQNFTEEERKELGIAEENVGFAHAPRRPKVLPAVVNLVTAKGSKYLIVVGLLNGAPYEVFAGKFNGNFDIELSKTKFDGEVTKVKRGHYSLTIKAAGKDGSDIVIDDFSENFTPVERSLFRLISTSLRHGVPIKFVVEQLQKSTNDIGSVTAAAARVLKQFIKDGEKAHGKTCPECSSTDLFYNDGCVTCSCGWSKCS